MSRNISLIGITGAGKSTTANILVRDSENFDTPFITSSRAASQSTKVKYDGLIREIDWLMREIDRIQIAMASIGTAGAIAAFFSFGLSAATAAITTSGLAVGLAARNADLRSTSVAISKKVDELNSLASEEVRSALVERKRIECKIIVDLVRD